MYREFNTTRMAPGKLRIVLPGGTGTVEIDTELHCADGASRVQVTVQSDTDRYGPAVDGRAYAVENDDSRPGVVFLTQQPLTRDPAPQQEETSPSMAGLSRMLGHLIDPKQLKREGQQ